MNRRKFVSQSVAAFAASTVVPPGGATSLEVRNSSASGPTFILDAKPSPITVDVTKTAVIVVDMQNDFGSKGGMFDRAGIDISMIQRAVEHTARTLVAARKAGINVIYLKMAYLPDLSDIGIAGSPNRRVHEEVMHVGTPMRSPSGADTRILVRDTWNTDVVDALKPHADDTTIYKTRFNGFFRTDLDEKLKALGARYLIFTGCTTSVCVESTIREAMFRDYSPILLEDCTGEPVGNGLTRSNHDATLLLIQLMFGWVSNSEQFIKALAGAVPTSKS